MSRFAIITDRSQMALPSSDYLTGKSDSEFYVDLDIDADLGRVYLSKESAEELAKLIGWCPGDKNYLNELHIKNLEKENDELRDLLDNAGDAATALLHALRLTPYAAKPGEGSEDEPEGNPRANHPSGKGRNGPSSSTEFE